MALAEPSLVHATKPIPFEKGGPFLGSLVEIAKDVPGYLLKMAQKYEDIVYIDIPFRRIAVVCSAEMCREILSTQNDRFRKGDFDMSVMNKIIGNGLVTNNIASSHKTQRKLVQPGFHFRKIEGYADIMSQYTARYLNDWPATGKRDLNHDMFKLTMYIVCKTLFDVDMEDLEGDAATICHDIAEMQRISNSRFLRSVRTPEWIPTPNRHRVRARRASLNRVLKKMIEVRRQEGDLSNRNDLMSMLLEAKYEDGSPITEEQLLDELVTLFLAGHETTSNGLTWTLYYLAKHPEIQAKLYAEVDSVIDQDLAAYANLKSLEYTEQVFKEAMRIRPPVWTLNDRQANEDTQVGDYLIKKDTILFLSPYALHNNSKYFKNPEVYDPERFTEENEKKLPRYAYMPFGGGPRVCIGNSFAMMEAKLILATLVNQFHFEALSSKPPREQAFITLSPEGGLPLKVSQR